MIVFSFQFVEKAEAQKRNGALLDRLVQQLDTVANQNISIEYRPDTAQKVKYIRPIFSLSADTVNKYQSRIDELKAQQRVLQGDIGLDLEAGYLQNFEAGLFNEAGIFYKRRARVGLDWKLLKNGWLDNHYKIEDLETRRQVISGTAEHEVSPTYFDRIHNRIVYLFNRQKVQVLQSYLHLLSGQEKVAVALYHQNYRTWDDILTLTSEKARINRLLINFQNLNRQYASLGLKKTDASGLPIVNINLEMLVQAAENQPAVSSMDRQSFASYHPITDISLSASVDYNFYSNAPEEQLTGTTGQREFVSASINLSVPLPMKIGANKDLIKVERRHEKTDRLQERNSLRQKIYAMYSQYQQLLSEYARDYINYQKYNEVIRRLMVKKKLDDPEYSPKKLVDVLAQRALKALQLINNSQKMYEKLLDIYTITYQTPPRQYVYKYEFDIPELPVSSAYQWSIYIWSSTFKAYPERTLISYLQAHHFDTVFLSAGTQPDMKKVTSFVDKAHEAGIRVQWMIGDNHLIQRERHAKLKDEVKDANLVGADGLHLDVEPQTFSDWDEKQTQYKKDYLAMVKVAAKMTKAKELELSLSVPVYFDDIISDVSRYADNIQLMAYGTNDIGKIKSRIENELQTAPDKIGVALRPSDFENYDVLKSSVEKLKTATGATRFSVHDLASMLKMEGLNK